MSGPIPRHSVELRDDVVNSLCAATINNVGHVLEQFSASVLGEQFGKFVVQLV